MAKNDPYSVHYFLHLGAVSRNQTGDRKIAGQQTRSENLWDRRADVDPTNARITRDVRAVFLVDLRRKPRVDKKGRKLSRRSWGFSLKYLPCISSTAGTPLPVESF